MNKKPLFIALILLILLSGCHKETARKAVDTGIIEKMDFNKIPGFYTHNVNDTENSALIIYGTYDGINEADLKELNSLPIEITLLTAGGSSITCKKENVSWSSGEPVILKDRFSLKMVIDPPIEYNGKLNHIIFSFNGKQIKKELENY